jgi:hypothetical protein
MYRFVPTIVATSNLALAMGGSTALSREAHFVSEAATEFVKSTERSEALSGDKNAVLSDLAALGTDYANPGWDGGHAAPIDPVAMFFVRRFVHALPYGISMPELAPEPDGSVSLDWSASRNRVFSLSIGPSNRLAFAWLDGADTGYATAQFDGIDIPSLVLDQIRKLVGNARAPLRAA